MKRKKVNPVRQMVRCLDLPEFVAGSEEWIEICGGNTVLVEGAKGIHTYENEVVKIHMKKDILVLRGCGFDLAHFGNGCLRVTGTLYGVEWEGRS